MGVGRGSEDDGGQQPYYIIIAEGVITRWNKGRKRGRVFNEERWKWFVETGKVEI